MRKFIPAFLAVVIMAVSASAAEKQTFLNGVVSVTVPDGWRAEMDGKDLALSVINPASPVTRVIFSTPNINSGGDASVPFERNLDLMYMFFGSELNILDEQENASVGGKSGMSMLYKAKRGDMMLEGKMFTFAQEGATVLSIAISTDEDFDKFEKEFAAIIQSYQVDGQALNANRQRIQEISDESDALYEDLVDELEAIKEETVNP